MGVRVFGRPEPATPYLAGAHYGFQLPRKCPRFKDVRVFGRPEPATPLLSGSALRLSITKEKRHAVEIPLALRVTPQSSQGRTPPNHESHTVSTTRALVSRIHGQARSPPPLKNMKLAGGTPERTRFTSRTSLSSSLPACSGAACQSWSIMPACSGADPTPMSLKGLYGAERPHRPLPGRFWTDFAPIVVRFWFDFV